MRYGELRRALPAIADKMLTQRRRELAEAGFIERSGDGDDDVMRYGLTAQGQSLAPVLSRLYEWGERIATAREGREPSGAGVRYPAGTRATSDQTKSV